MAVDLQNQVTDLTTATLVKSVAIGVAERIAIIAGTWLVSNKLLPEDQLTGVETLIGTAVLAAGVFGYTWWKENGRFLLMKKLQMEVPPNAVTVPVVVTAEPAEVIVDMNNNPPQA